MNTSQIRPDHRLILDLVKPRSTVLDLGCGNGELLELLIKQKSVRGHGIEIDERAIYECVTRGVSVFHGDVDSGLAEYKDKSVDYVILNQSLQQIRHVGDVLQDALRVGKYVIAGFPNFAHYRSRLQMFFRGRTPVTGALPYQWYETPNLHFLSTLDFAAYCRHKHIVIERAVYIGDKRRVWLLSNLFAQVGIFLITKTGDGSHRRRPEVLENRPQIWRGK